MNRPRTVGLDVLRVLAAAGVIVCHSGFFSVGIPFRVLSFAGIWAVEIFFALSGFLVGRSLIPAVLSPRPGRELGKFYVNRLLRTLPLYYGVLALTALTSGQAIPLSCFFFCQNFDAGALQFLPVSWSLCVEAWFYFLVPPALLLLTKLPGRKWRPEVRVCLALGLLCLVSLGLRTARSLPVSQDWDFEIRKQIPLRLDAILLGVLLSAFDRFAPRRCRALGSHGGCLALALAGIGTLYWAYRVPLAQGDGLNASAAGKLLMFTVLPLCCCALVLFGAYSPRFNALGQRLAGRWIVRLSKLSYGVYLLQLLVFSAVSPCFTQARFIVSWMGFFAAIALTVLLAQITYLLVEKPAEGLKNRLCARL